jgi:hypothetical protein
MSTNRRDAARRKPAPHFLDLPAAPFAFLLEAHDAAGEAGLDSWEFSVEISTLRGGGLTPTHLRWLLHKRYLLQAIEETGPEEERRRFRRVPNLSLSERACFILTAAGAAYACNNRKEEASQAYGSAERPVWDRVRQELRLGGGVVKRFQQPAPNQEKVLDAFQEEGWPPRIDDPLPPQLGQDPKRRLHSTISNLNRGQAGIRVLFGGGGDGQSVRWRLQAVRRQRGQGEDRAKTGRR